MKDIKDIFFDLDHTLWDFDRNSALAFKTVFKLNDISIDFTKFLEIYTPINFKYWKWYREDRVTKTQLRYGRLKKTFDGLGVTITNDIIDKLSNDYIAHLTSHNYLFDNAIDVLEYLSKKYNLHIITNGFQEVQLKKLVNSNINHYFNTIITSEAAGVKKPHARIFELALKESSASAPHSLMIGDTYEADIVGAESVGMKTICFNYHNAILPDTVVVINDLSELKNYL